MRVSDFMHEMRTTSAIFGRDSGAYVTFEGDQAYTDGKRINLPSLPVNAELTHEQVLTMRGFVDHEAGHVRHSNMPRIVDFYKRCINNDRKGLQKIHNCVEDVWMEGKVVNDYIGSQKNLRSTNNTIKAKEVNWLKESRKFIETGNPADLKSMDSKELNAMQDAGPEAIDQYRQYLNSICNEVSADLIGSAIKGYNPEFYNGRGPTQEFLDMMPDKIKEMAPVWAKQAAECKDSEECITLAKSIYKTLEDDNKLENTTPDNFDPQSGEGMDEGEPGDVSEQEAEQAMGRGKGDGKEKGKGRGGRFEVDKDYMPSPSDAVNDDGEAHDEMGGIGKLTGTFEGDKYRVYSTKNDVVYKKGHISGNGDPNDRLQRIVDSDDPTNYTKTRTNIAGEINAMSAKLRRALLSKDRRDWDFGKELGRLDSKRLVSGTLGNPNVYKSRIDRDEENTAVTFLIDLSGSMGGRKIEVARDCMVALTECLAASKMDFKVVGFANRGHGSDGYHNEGQGFHRYERTDTVVFKDYSQSLRNAKGAIGNINGAAGGNNSDYDFIANELAELRKRQERRKVLFVLSDGHPAHVSDASHDNIIRLCKKEISMAKKDGIECVGIGICDTAVKEIYDDHIVVNNVEDLSKTCFSKLTKILVG